MLPVTSKTHHVVRITIRDHLGTHDGGEVHVHVSRSCLNCSSYAPTSVDDWDAEVDGRCRNLCTAARHSEDGAYCADHQTAAEFEAGVHRPQRPVFGIVEGGIAA